MAYTYSKIATYTVGSGGVPSISFVNIPQTYTDLVIVASLRSNTGDVSSNTWLTFNSVGGTSYSARVLYTSNGTSVVSGSENNIARTAQLFSNSSTSTASTFGNMEIYIPNYTSSNYKSWSSNYVTENNAAAAQVGITGGLFSNVSPIASIDLRPYTADWAQYSTIHLYGIKAEV